MTLGSVRRITLIIDLYCVVAYTFIPTSLITLRVVYIHVQNVSFTYHVTCCIHPYSKCEFYQAGELSHD